MDFWEAPVLVLPELPELPELYAALGTEGMGGMDFVFFSDSFVFWQKGQFDLIGILGVFVFFLIYIVVYIHKYINIYLLHIDMKAFHI